MDPRPAVSAPALPSLSPQAPSSLSVPAASSLVRADTLPPPPSAPPLPDPPASVADPAKQDEQTPQGEELDQQEQDQLSSLLLGIPDRSATASAPPDLEISSRSLFAFKAGYSGIFSDIRLDDYYESFYNENSERLNLPPPLPNRAAHDQGQSHGSPRYLRRDDSDASINDLIFHETKGLRHGAPGSDSGLYQADRDADHSSQFRNPRRDRRDADSAVSTPQKGKPPAPRPPAPRPPTQPSAQQMTIQVGHQGQISDPASSEHFDAHSQPQLQKRPSQHALESRYSISRHASPRPVDPSTSSSHIVGNSLPPVPTSSPSPQKSHQDQLQGQQQQHVDKQRGHESSTVSHDQLPQLQPPQQSQLSQPRSLQPQLHRSASAPPVHQRQHLHHPDLADHSHDAQSHSSQHVHHAAGPQQHRYVSHAQRPQPHSAGPQTALWPSLNQLSLDDTESVGTTQSPRRIYHSASAPYPGPNSLRSPYESSYVYPQPGSPLEPQLSGPTSHLFDSPPQQHWARGMGGAPGPDLNGLYDPRYDAGLDQYAYKGRDDVLAMSAAMSPNLEALHGPAPSVLSYAGSGLSGRGLYPQQRQLSGRGSGSGSGRSNGRSRNHSSHGSGPGNSAFGYMYGTRAAASVVVPNAPDYLNAQAAAAAAAAAAAVYKSGGVHINGTGPGALSSYGGGGPPGLANRPLAMLSSIRGGGKGGDVRRSGMHEPYSRGGMKMGGMGSDGRDSYVRGGGSSSYRSLDDSGSYGGGGGSGGNSGSGKFSSFNDIIGRAEELARDQHGCRFLQTKLEEGNSMYINSIFEECYEKFVDLMTDPFGNYLCQKLFEHCNDSQRLALVERCAPAFPRVSTNMHGTRAVQRMVECLSTPAQVQAVCAALAPAAVALMKDINGNHVIQRCLHRMDPAHNQFVYDAVANNCFELATHRHGCCVMQRCMDYASPAQRNQLATQINANALPLVQNAFGNYVVQYVLGLNDPTYTSEIIRRLRGHLAELSMQKFSSNVVEKGLQQGDREVRRELIFELISDPDTMRRLLHDAYGNYVIQRALQIAESPQLEQICEAIRPHLNSLRQSPYGKRIQAKIQKRMPKGMPPSIASS